MNVKETHIFDNNDGQGLIRIKPFGLGEYLYSNTCNTIAWYDCRGSVGKYIAHIKAPSEIKAKILESLRLQINSGNEINWAELVPDLEFFSKVFPKGQLIFRLFEEHPSKESFEKYSDYEYILPKKVIKQNEKAELQSWLRYFNKNLDRYGYIHSNITEMTTSGFYDAYYDNLIFTQSEDSLNRKTIKEYKRIIKSGKRPVCLVYNPDFEEENNYVIDGHHKLMAYKKLKIKPVILEISQATYYKSPYSFDLNELGSDLCNVLYEWQLKHIFVNGIADSQKNIKKIIASPESPFHKFVKNGIVEEFWINGNLKKRGNYIENQADGIIETFHENGAIKTHELYENGRQIRIIQSWDPRGNLTSEFIQKDDYLNGEYFRYYSNGKISSKTVYINGMNADGKSDIAYHPNGNIQYEANYNDGKLTLSRYYDSDGKLIEEYIS